MKCDDQTVPGYDVIGDIHGCADPLESLLETMGYRHDDGAYRHPSRQAVFVGDLIDRGSQQLRVLETVKAMADVGSAQITMGNHEFNAICYGIPGPGGGYLRPHSDKNARQHHAFLEQLTAEQQRFYLDWFRTIPLWLDLGGLRVVHACWHEPSMKIIEQELGSNIFRSGEQFAAASTRGHLLYDAVETLIKGPELSLADHGQLPYLDKDGHARERARLRWWSTGSTLRELAEIASTFTTQDGVPYPELPALQVASADHVYRGDVPVVYGHYWRTGTPEHGADWTDRTACVDFSAVKGGALTAYRWSGESTVRLENYVQAPPPST
ncbi:metallophosphoesterase [Mycolicibacterium mucogenicum]|uniref:metallophosphoesterase n=1 Tax=Mycolicibacterium mucogenicum TaxID=56689 RepID=UPI000AC64870|nr:metallophosphoesterase [Mycolicibacterium mucogenicum]